MLKKIAACPILDIDIKSQKWCNSTLDIQHIHDLSFKVCNSVFSMTSFYDHAKQPEISVVLADNEFIKELNRDYRGIDASTNVLSFPAEELDPQNFKKIKTIDGFIVLGDIVFSYETVKYESESANIPFIDHFCHLLIHSLLHLLGYIHDNEEQAMIMEELEVKILENFNIKDPYESYLDKKH